MLFVEAIRKITKLAIASAYLEDEKQRLNIILLGNPESGKSSILLSFKYPAGVKVLTDVTRAKLAKILKDIKDPEKDLKYMIIPDLTVVRGHSKTVEKGIISFLNACIEEGVYDVTQYLGSGFTDITEFKKPIRFGIATSLTRQIMEDRRRQGFWYSTGFLSRFLPVSYSYTEDQIKKIREYIAGGLELDGDLEKIVVKGKPKRVVCDIDDVLYYGKYIDKLAAASMTYGFRYTRHFRLMLKAHAMLRGSNKVEAVDVKEVEKLLKWVNLDYNPVEDIEGGDGSEKNI
jgi:hypothetical protein